MAGDWIKWTKGLARKREVLLIASMLEGETRYSVAARLMEVWEWCDDNISESDADDDGHAFVTICHARSVTSVTKGSTPCNLIDGIAGVTGFADAMSAVGWLSIRSSSLAFPNFYRHNADPAKQRALASNRQQQRRAKSVTQMSRSQRDKSVTREEKRREEKRVIQNTPCSPPVDPRLANEVQQPAKGPLAEELPLPPPLDTPDFRSTWREWIGHRRSRGWRARPDTMRRQLEALAPLGSALAVQCLLLSLRNDYQGIFPEKFQHDSKTGGRGGRSRDNSRSDPRDTGSVGL